MDRFLRNPQTEVDNMIEVLDRSLYFAVLKGSNSNRKLKSNGEMFYFSIDDELLYQNYYCDFGPLNISCLYKYCNKLNKYLEYARGLKGIVHYTCSHPDKKANAAYLMGCYCVIHLNMEPRNFLNLIQGLGPFKPFLDASQFACQFTLKLIDCYNAVGKARIFNFFDFDDFNASEYDLYNKLEYGDLNWLLPRKFIAFSGPVDNTATHPPEYYIKYFLKNDIKTVIRLNNVLYDARAFMQVGIQHYDLIFPDGSTPPKDILLKFLYIAETAPAAIAVHCKAGLGRTGSLIGAYIIKHYRMSAREAIAWLRMCRPGSVIGQQQVWLEKIQSWLWRVGSQYRLHHYGEGDKIPRHKYGIYSKMWPIEREKYIREARKSIQAKFTNSQISSFMQVQSKGNSSADRIGGANARLLPSAGDSFKNISKLLSSVHGMRQKCITNCKNELTTFQEVQKMQKQFNSVKSLASIARELSPKKIVKNVAKKRSEKALQKSHHNITHTKPHFKTASTLTQGDKLNEIKAIRNQKTKIQKCPKCKPVP